MTLVVLFIGLWVTMFGIAHPMPAGFGIVLVAEALTLCLFVRLISRARSERGLNAIHYSLLTVELGFHTAIVYFLGGVAWLGSVAYIYAVIYATPFLNVRQAIAFATAVAACYLTLISLVGAGVIPHYWYLPQGPERFRDPDFLIPTAVAFTGVIATITFWMVFIGNELRRERDAAMKANEQLVKAQDDLRFLNEELEKKVEERTRALAYRAEHDQLTGLLNRGTVMRRCQELLVLARRGERSLALIVADSDGLKACNDQGGHSYGDDVLRTLADLLRECSRESDVVGRMGGDEFLVALPDTDAQGAALYSSRLTQLIEEKCKHWKHPDLPRPGFSLGIAIYPDHGSDLEELIRTADVAMYEAKAQPGSTFAMGTSGATLPRRRGPQEMDVGG